MTGNPGLGRASAKPSAKAPDKVSEANLGRWAMKKQDKPLKQNKKPKSSYWLVRADRRKGAVVPKLPAGCGK
jgi:hypothetical protein